MDKSKQKVQRPSHLQQDKVVNAESKAGKQNFVININSYNSHMSHKISYFQMFRDACHNLFSRKDK